MKIALVVQRYGRQVVGGSETLARNIAERLAANGHQVCVFSTTALDYISWRHELPEGESLLRGVRIRRFRAVEERDIAAFNSYSESFFSRDPTERDELEWLRRQGPYCPDLPAALAAEQKDFDLFFFFTYLYHPTVAGLELVRKPAVLFPTAHDEAPLHLKLMRPVFSRPELLFFLTTAEMELVRRVFKPSGRMQLLRTGLDIPPPADDCEVRRRYALYGPYVLYAGRIERGKGLETVFSSFPDLAAGRHLTLALIGKKLMDLPSHPAVRHLGYVSEEEKAALFRGARFSLQPSPLESLSITTLESFSQATPVLVNGLCPALVEHVEASGGGLAYRDGAEFRSAFLRLLSEPKAAREMGCSGLDYVRNNFSWPVVMARLESACRELTAAAPGS